jgi:shikimate dehydrogenase
LIRLGLIGGNIAASRSPLLHRECGRLAGLQVDYRLMVPNELGLDFDGTFDRCRELGMAGFNVTLPYKELVMRRVTVADPLVARIGAVNTVRLAEGGGAEGHNTDHTGFIEAFRAAFDFAPGRVALIGSGGVGKAIGFALVALGAGQIRVVDKDLAKAEALALALAAAGADASAVADAAAGMDGADGAVNCTPLGMHGYPGSPVRDTDFRGTAWAFDAVYTPEHTPFRAQARAAGARFLSGWELFFWQGVQAFEIFTGVRPVKLAELRARLLEVA